jgi:hypothetical protein
MAHAPYGRLAPRRRVTKFARARPAMRAAACCLLVLLPSSPLLARGDNGPATAVAQLRPPLDPPNIPDLPPVPQPPPVPTLRPQLDPPKIPDLPPAPKLPPV